LQDSPTDTHQTIVNNIGAELRSEKRRLGADWSPIPGIGTRARLQAPTRRQPDVMVVEGAPTGINETSELLVAIEIMSRSNGPKDRTSRRKAYRSIPKCQHYIVVEQDRVEVVRYDRAEHGWRRRKLSDISDTLALPALGGVSISLAEIYWNTPLAPAA
jgi:Uma2 family endonuclease